MGNDYNGNRMNLLLSSLNNNNRINSEDINHKLTKNFYERDNKKKSKKPGRLFLKYRNDKNKPSTTNTINNTISNTRTTK